ncbi:MAG: T9SS type A sorting domain-containing protein [Bacteroidia bacterium]|nr:T9SS type A sorting domain-containing protein [Bacteroidia bacterium]
MYKFSLLILSCVFYTGKTFSQTIPKLSNDTLLDIACWNVEWFGDTQYGPTDETLQYNNIKAMMLQTDFDILAMEEISNITTYNNLSAETAVAAKYDTYISTFSATQKMGLYWKKSMFEVVGVNTLNILTNENYNFATRPPLQVCLKTKGGTKTDTLYVIVLHMKAQTDNTITPYTRRKGAADALKTYIEQSLENKKYVIVGDWNDDLSVSIYNGMTTPYLNFLNAEYTFPSKELTTAGKKSFVRGTAMIDHIMQSKTLDSFYYKNTAQVFDIAANYISDYGNTTTDHYPVYAFYNWKKLTTYIPSAGINQEVVADHQIQLYPNPAKETVKVTYPEKINEILLCDLSGKVIFQTTSASLDLSMVRKGFYFVWVLTDKGNKVTKLIIE